MLVILAAAAAVAVAAAALTHQKVNVILYLKL